MLKIDSKPQLLIIFLQTNKLHYNLDQLILTCFYSINFLIIWNDETTNLFNELYLYVNFFQEINIH